MKPHCFRRQIKTVGNIYCNSHALVGVNLHVGGEKFPTLYVWLVGLGKRRYQQTANLYTVTDMSGSAQTAMGGDTGAFKKKNVIMNHTIEALKNYILKLQQ